MSKSLFDVTDHWTEKANEIEHEVHAVLKPIFDKYADQQYSVRDLAYVMSSTVSDLCVTRAIQNQMNTVSDAQADADYQAARVEARSTDNIITYANRMDPTGQRFRQYAKDPVPAWAVDVRPE